MKKAISTNIPSVFSVVALLLLPVTGLSQTVIGSWQTASDDGWIDWGNQLSITDPTNAATYSFASGVVGGYAQSLQITEAGYQQNLAIKLQNNGYVDDFLNNHLLTFTFSVPAWTNGGYSEVAQLAISAQGYGFVGQAFDSRWSSTGDTGNNDGTKPRFFFWDGSPARSQTVTFDYSDVLADTNLPANPGWLELVFTFNNGGGAPAVYYMNEVVLSSAPSPALLVNAFDDSTEVTDNNGSPWVGWFGDARDEPPTEWDPSDANGATNSGSMKINAFFPESFFYPESGGPQFLVYNDAWFDDVFGTNGMPGFGNTMTNYVATNISFDLRFDPNSAYYTNTMNWPTIEVGCRGNLGYGSQPVFGSIELPHSETNWVHVDIPIGPSSDWQDIHAIFFKHYGPTNLDGEVDLYVDNIEITLGEIPRPTLALEEATPGLRIFAGSSGLYDRQQLTSVDTNQSWIGGSYPVSYSFTLSEYGDDPPLGQVHLFLIPVDHVQGGLGGINSYTDYSTASNNVWLQIVGGESNVTANISWKTNLIGANPDQVALEITNATAVGTWVLTFNSASGGTLTAPGGGPVPFTIDDPGIATDFDNPLMVFVGVQPNYEAAIGQHVNFTQIQTIGVASPGVPINSDFTTGGLDTNVWSTSASFKPSSIVPVSASQPWWLNWDFAAGYELSTKAELENGLVPWKTPGYYTGYQPGAIFNDLMADRVWALIPEEGLPTTDGLSNGVPGNAAFFRLENPPPAE
jgi:hypothetical protein